MSFPVNSVLDNFNRTGEGPPPTGWSAVNATWKQLVIPDTPDNTYSTPQSGSDNLEFANFWSASTFGPDTEAFVTLINLGTDDWDRNGVILRGSTGGSGVSGYNIIWSKNGTSNGSGAALTLQRVVNDAATEFGTEKARAFSSGYKIGATVTGTGADVTIEVFTDEGSGWVSRGTWTDSDASRITSSGYIGIQGWEHGGVTCRADDFGGGDLSSGSPQTVTLNAANLSASVANVQSYNYQIVRPTTDTSLGGWTDQADGTSSIYTAIDETTASDSDFVQSPNNPSTSIYKFKIGTISDPGIHANNIVAYRYRKPEAVGTVNLKVRLIEGTTTRKEWTHSNIGTSWTTQEQTLTEGEAATITDYSNLYLELEAG